MATDFFKKFVNDLKEPDTSIAADGTASSEFTGFIDSGSLLLNAALSGTMFGGIPNNKVTVFAGDPATGKTFFALGIVKAFLDANKNGRVFYFDTESAVTNQMMEARGIDPKRVAKSEPDTIEKFRNTAVKVLDGYKALEDKFPMLIVLDSLSALPSKKEIQDVTEEKDTKDMTKPGIIKGTFRIIRLKMGQLGVPFVVTNHVYSTIGQYINTKVPGGGMGAQYAADTLVMLSKKQEKVDDEIIGNVVHAHMKKSRLSRENTKVDTRILFNGGLDRYYGLLPFAVEAGLVKHIANKYEFPDGQKAFEKAINKEPATYFTPALLKDLDEYMKTQFTYSAGVANGE
jgi:RecA/RadA recombinase